MAKLVRCLGVLFGIGLILTFLAFLGFFIKSSFWPDTQTQADVAVVLGTKTYVDGQLNECLLARLNKGIDLVKQNKVKALIMTGGRDQLDQPTQAQILASLARYQGVSASVIWTENKSSDTWENIKFAKQIIDKNKWQTVLVVTEPYHLLRALMIANHFGLDSAPSKVIASPCWQDRFTRFILTGRDFVAYLKDSWRAFSEN